MKTSDGKKAKAIADYLSHGNVSKAASDNQLDRSTLHRWLQKDAPEVKAAKGAIMDRIYDDIVSLLEATLTKLRARMKDDNLAAPQLAIIAGILADKAARLAPRVTVAEGEDGGTWVIQVRRGGARVSTGQVDADGLVVAQVVAEAKPRLKIEGQTDA